VTSVQKAGARGVEISVEDHGPGFAPEILARLGEPFQTTKPPSAGGTASGMGLGLYVSATLARELGWTLRVHTAAGGGARVALTIDGGTEGEQG
jgi:two-component system, sensor histidine kinase RegB